MRLPVHRCLRLIARPAGFARLGAARSLAGGVVLVGGMLLHGGGVAVAQAGAAGCPQAPGAVRMIGSAKHDGWVCEAKLLKTDEEVLHVYVGARPQPPKDLRYHSTTGSTGQPLVWFVASSDDPEQRSRKTYYAFLPLKGRANAVMMAYFTTCTEDDFRRRARVASQLRIV
ncbi:MAG: hypothetical protein AVDCRST_MAG71-1158 [uncultured Lysobacter sp.]|uniref:Uncharacterized protein n=1 Tax=uncultured Lysobacter sp. TaxID=271060 RepID=A0A6J4KZW7_9GAMM|nr:MAG: hypothetical protein AVDCRST_MAG71-1158 [uncultured Lysobacter sp.]